MPETSIAQRVCFGEFTADLASQELFRSGVPVRLPNQSFVALAAMLERPGQLVTREELRARVWPDHRVVEFEQGLNAVINRLRDALGDDADQPAYVETLPRRGYRFIGRIDSSEPDAAAAAPPEPASAPGPATPLPAPVAATRRFPWLTVLALACLLLAASFAYWRLRESRGAPAPLAVVTPLTSLVGVEQMPALSPDASRLAFAWNGESAAASGFDLYVKPAGSERHMRLTYSSAAAVSAAWSPDGTQLAFARVSARDGGVFMIPATGGAERKLAEAAFAQESLAQPAWSPDGKTLAYAATDESGSQILRLLTLASLENRPISPPSPCWHAGAPAWIGDGRQLAFVCMTSIAVYDIQVVEPASAAGPRPLAKLQGFPRGLAWSKDRGRLLVANDGGDGGGVWELELNGTLHRPAVPEDSIGIGVSAAAGHIAYSRSRQLINIWHVSLEPDAPGATRWIFSTRDQLTPQYSRDGARIAFQSNRSGSPEIWLADADGGNPVRLTSIGGPLTGAPAWCSDGRRLAFDSRESGTSAIYIVDVFERVPRRVETSRPNLALPTWSPDCTWLLASDGRATLYRVPAAGGTVQRFTSQRSYQAIVIADRVIFNVAEPSGVVLWMKPLAGGTESPVPGMPRLTYSDSWTASDGAIYFTGVRNGQVTVFRHDLRTLTTQSIALLPNEPTPLGGLGLAVAPDNEALLYTHTEDTQSDLALIGELVAR